jgi:hypothetical protein
MYGNKEHDHRRFKRPRLPSGIVFGLFLIYLGAAFLLENLSLIYIEDALVYCPCVLIALGIVRLWNKGVFNIWGQILLSSGLLLQVAFLWDLEAIETWWPMLIVWVGVIVAFRAFVPKKNHPNVQLVPSHKCHLQRQDDIDMTSITVGHED